MQQRAAVRLRWGLFFGLGWIMLLSVSLAQGQSAKFRVAVLTPGGIFDGVLEGLREGLARAGYDEGKNLSFMIEDTGGNTTDVTARAARLVEAKPDVFVSVATTQTAAAKGATTSIPIVFAGVGDPVGSGFIASFASSRNNLTGASIFSPPLSAKRLEVLKEVAPTIKRVLAIVAIKEVIAASAIKVLDETAEKLGVQLVRRDVTTGAEFEQVLQDTPAGSVDAIFHIPASLMVPRIDQLIAKAKEDKIPIIVTEESLVQRGALLSFGADFKDSGVQAAKLVVKILHGTKPAELPTQMPEKFVLAINLTTAKAIGLEIPRDVVERADRILE